MQRAIALGGGGTKGAYEMGIWKAMNEVGMEYQIVTGTSIGSINGALMATRDYNLASELWDTIEMEKVMADGVNLTTTIEGMYNQREAIKPFLKKYVKNKGADISPFLEFIDRLIDEERVRASDIDFGLVTVRFSTLTALELSKKEIPDGRLKDYIMASSSIFPIFPMHRIDGELYLDGCYYDNLPIDLALKMGADEVVAVDLHNSPEHPGYVNKPYVTYITPSRPLGTMLNFERTVLDENRKLGYYDGLKAFGRLVGNQFLFYQSDLDQYQEEIRAFVTQVARTESYLTEGSFNKIVKPGDSRRLCGCIEDQLPKKTYTRQDYFLGAAEICGVIFGLPVQEPWHLEAYVDCLLSRVEPADRYEELAIFDGLGSMELATKLAELKLRRDSAYIAGCVYQAYRKGKVNLTEQLGLLTFVPYELAAALFLAQWKK